ncbi:dephospho-CoA kinase [Fastidiosibacter lacustris]|uniref:dephospho-CoA kinase n=1 Tax=Fastidiosibacter lacustris TaxID=2056695 RepID=UPI000E348298|nr:dephospho-CoA kinase [Fastidiosibacter lacustris]
MYPVALTGGIGSGKTTVASLFAQRYHIEVICADQYAKKTIELPHVIEAIYQHFGKNVVQNNMKVNRLALRKIISLNAKDRLWLNNLMHPIIRKQIEDALKLSQSAYTIVDIPLLTQSTLSNYSYLKKVICVCAPFEIKVQRIMARDKQTKKNTILMINSQISDDERRKFSDFIIENDHEISLLLPQIDKIHNSIMVNLN